MSLCAKYNVCILVIFIKEKISDTTQSLNQKKIIRPSWDIVNHHKPFLWSCMYVLYMSIECVWCGVSSSVSMWHRNVTCYDSGDPIHKVEWESPIASTKQHVRLSDEVSKGDPPKWRRPILTPAERQAPGKEQQKKKRRMKTTKRQKMGMRMRDAEDRAQWKELAKECACGEECVGVCDVWVSKKVRSHTCTLNERKSWTAALRDN